MRGYMTETNKRREEFSSSKSHKHAQFCVKTKYNHLQLASRSESK
jgi:hypothetical protein